MIMNLYLFEDIYYRYRKFFNVRAEDSRLDLDFELDANSRFLYDFSFGFMPRHFDPSSEEDRIIYDEEDTVTEMYFILDGTIGVGYNMFGIGKSTSENLNLENPL